MSINAVQQIDLNQNDVVDGEIVKEYNIGDTKIKICNAEYKDKTPEEIDLILKRVEAIGWEIVEQLAHKNRLKG
ncbi:hypothetical protein [Mahella australiensis]|uniref:Uncharacterized protein n=1 Tax=Mahella australiensis (strain DSM 15567 / CIP 107919 / 50-1 BON) TaxID=697281 RepID=F3ZWE0_MAHA5|nr:hypothetical protein [Mahella australiensis]AEE97549.1 hypothetical protein Mahau_2385 [Mahella australiensis 50-1 BON]